MKHVTGEKSMSSSTNNSENKGISTWKLESGENKSILLLTHLSASCPTSSSFIMKYNISFSSEYHLITHVMTKDQHWPFFPPIILPRTEWFPSIQTLTKQFQGLPNHPSMLWISSASETYPTHDILHHSSGTLWWGKKKTLAWTSDLIPLDLHFLISKWLDWHRTVFQVYWDICHYQKYINTTKSIPPADI